MLLVQLLTNMVITLVERQKKGAKRHATISNTVFTILGIEKIRLVTSTTLKMILCTFAKRMIQ